MFCFVFFAKYSEQPTPPPYFPPSYTVPTLKFFSHCKLFSMFLPLRIVSALKETTVIAKPCITKQWYLSAQYNLGFHEDTCLIHDCFSLSQATLASPSLLSTLRHIA